MSILGRWGGGIAFSVLVCTTPGSIAAADMVAAYRTAFQAVCAEHGGDFDQGWRFDDEDSKWGRVITCTADTVSITCEGEACAARRDGPSAIDQVLTFAAEPTAFANVLDATLDD